MENKDLTLFFFIIYDFIITFIFLLIIYKLLKDKKELEKYTDELIFELAKARQK